MNNFLKPEVISGFPEWLPEERILEQGILDMIRYNFEKQSMVWNGQVNQTYKSRAI